MDSNELTQDITHEQHEPIQSFSYTEGLSDDDDIASEQVSIYNLDNRNEEESEEILAESWAWDDDDNDDGVIESQSNHAPTSYSISAHIDAQSWAILRGELASHGLNEETSFSEYVQKLIENRTKAFQKEGIAVTEIQKTEESKFIAPPTTHFVRPQYSKTSIALAIAVSVLVLGFIIWAIWKIRKNAAIIQQAQTGFNVT